MRSADDDDRYLITPLEGPMDPNAPHVTVDCTRSGCRMSFFVAKDDPRLPDGPFLCADHDDTPTMKLAPDYVEASLFCDRCDATLIAEGPTREVALAKLRARVVEHRWRIIDRFDAMPVSSAHAPDLCGACARKL